VNALVTGGGGFLGGAIVRRLVDRGDSVRSLARGDYPELRRLGVETIRGDVGDGEIVARAVDGVDVVFHVAAKAGIWGPRSEFVRANVDGTRNVLEACRSRGVGRLVFTSSPSVVSGGGDLEGVDESIPYPTRFEAFYPETKAEAERMVLEANGPDLATVALRPHLIWGPGDNHLIPRIIDRAKAGRLRRIGDRPNLVDSIYIDNAADAHLLAADRLEPGSTVSGRAYFLSQGDPWPLWDLINGILRAADLPPVERRVSPAVAGMAGAFLEGVHRLFRLPGEPAMTRFLAHQLSTAHWFNIEAARRDLGYRPAVSIEEGLGRLGRWFSEGRHAPSTNSRDHGNGPPPH
jgi:2-alkyl-3-oxoalkanoate reductase